MRRCLAPEPTALCLLRRECCRQSFGSLRKSSHDRTAPCSATLRPGEPLEVLRVVLGQRRDRPSGVSTVVHAVRRTRWSAGGRRGCTFGGCLGPSPRRRVRKRAPWRPARDRHLQVVGSPTISSPEDGPRFDDRLHPLCVTADVGVEAPRHGPKRGTDLGTVGVRGHVEDHVMVRHAWNVHAQQRRASDRNEPARDDDGVLRPACGDARPSPSAADRQF